MPLFQITLPYACGGIETEAVHPSAKVTKTAPIFHWMLGKMFSDIEFWVVRKHGTIKLVSIAE